MSEQAPQSVNQNPTDAMSVSATMRDLRRAEGWVGDTATVSDHTLDDFDAYLEKRPTEAGESTHEQDTLESTDYSKMHNSVLIRKWAEAEDAGDKTTAGDVQDEIMDRVANRTDRETDEEKRQVLDSFIARKDALRTVNDPETDSSQSLWDRLAAVPDMEKSEEQNSYDEFQKDMDNLRDVVLRARDAKKANNFNDYQQALNELSDLVDDFRGRYNVTDEYYDQIDKSINGGNEDQDVNQTPEDEDEIDQTQELPQLIEAVSPELWNALQIARAEYVRASAKRRGVSFGHKKRLNAAREAYEMAVTAVGENVAARMRELGADEETVRQFGVVGNLKELEQITELITQSQIEASKGKGLSRFYDFWARQRGVKGYVVKSSTMGVAGLIPGMAMGAVGAVLLGPVAGVVAGAGVARGVARGLMGAKVNKEADAARVAQAQNARQLAADNARFGILDQASEVTQADHITEGVDELTTRNNRRNKRRMIGSAAIGAVAGGTGAYFFNEWFGGGGKTPVARTGGNTTGTAGSGTRTGGIGTRASGSTSGGNTPAGTPGSTSPRAGEGIVADNRYPWTHFADKVGADRATPTILDRANILRGRGFVVNGETPNGPGSGRINSIVGPNGDIYTRPEEINYLLDLAGVDQ